MGRISGGKFHLRKSKRRVQNYPEKFPIFIKPEVQYPKLNLIGFTEIVNAVSKPEFKIQGRPLKDDRYLKRFFNRNCSNGCVLPNIITKSHQIRSNANSHQMTLDDIQGTSNKRMKFQIHTTDINEQT